MANAGVGGRGGGAIYLLAKDMIAVFGTINASGSGGGKPGDGAGGGGGGGGGSGGVIGLEALTFEATTDVFALGGGGAGGAISLEPGRPSDEAEGATLPADPAGQTADFNSGGGGSAINNGNIGGDTAITNAGGGGGGGASGFIFLFGNGTQLGTFAPPPT